jgi:hypothetical protein
MEATQQKIGNAILVRSLEEIRKESGGILRPADVVRVAEAEDHPLHSAFEWDDTEAAREYRLNQARHLIKVAVMVMPQTEEPYQVYVSMRADREGEGGGYRRVVDVLSREQSRTHLLEEAMRDLEYWQRKYAMLTELAGVFDAIKKARTKR